MERTCEECGKVFETKGSHSRTKTCSRSCGTTGAWRRRRERLEYPDCATCGKRLASLHRLFCSRSCAAQRKRRWCIVADEHGAPCGKSSESRTLGMCGTHARRHMAGIDLIRGARHRLADGERHVNRSNGYVRVKIDGHTVTEHRYLMEQLLCRPLLAGETVHHINGDKTDNRIDGPLDEELKSGNLQLWTTLQPPGQRVVDKIEWAVQFLKQYAPEMLA